MSTMSTPELSRIKSVRVPRRMYVSKFQRYGGAAIVVVLAVAVGAGMLPGSIDRQTSLEEKRRLERETWCDVGEVPLRLPGEPAEEPRPRPSEPRLERGSNECESRPPIHETARRRD